MTPILDVRRRRWAVAGFLLGVWPALVSLGCASAGPAHGLPTAPSGWPVARAPVTAQFGVPRSGGDHQGIDLAAPKGSAVRVTADGEVVFAGRDGRYGRTVVVDHGGGYATRYAHLKKVETKPGKRVRRGDLIGRVGSSGRASGPHLHYEVILNGTPVNPRPYLD